MTTATQIKCPKCNGEMREINGKRGTFYGCKRFPKCRATVDPNRPAPKIPNITGSPQQQAIWREIEFGTTHLIVEAGAGCGKTTTIVVGCAKASAGLRIGFVAFNASIARELSERVPQGTEAMTLHSLGLRAIRNAFPQVKVEKDKMEGIVDDLIKYAGTVKEKEADFVKSAVLKLVSLCKSHLDDGTNRESLLEIAYRHDIELNDSEAKILPFVPKALANAAKKTDVVDFDDMIWLPVVLGLAMPRYDLLFVDEAQDLNACQQKLCLAAIAGDIDDLAGRMILVGDRKQAIYGFRGADVQSIPNMERQLAATVRGVQTLPLTMTRRCPKLVVSLVNSLVPSLEAMEQAPEGTVEEILKDPLDLMKVGDMALCRTNAPLIKTAYALLKKGTRATIRGRDIGKSIATLVKKVGGKTVADLIANLEKYRAKQAAKFAGSKRAETLIANLDDKCDCIIAIAEANDTIAKVLRACDELFSEFDADGKPKESVVLSSIHRAKGLESKRVWILHPDQLPHKCATSPWELEQEANLAYVAATRSMSELYFCGPIPAIYYGGRA